MYIVCQWKVWWWFKVQVKCFMREVLRLSLRMAKNKTKKSSTSVLCVELDHKVNTSVKQAPKETATNSPETLLGLPLSSCSSPRITTLLTSNATDHCQLFLSFICLLKYRAHSFAHAFFYLLLGLGDSPMSFACHSISFAIWCCSVPLCEHTTQFIHPGRCWWIFRLLPMWSYFIFLIIPVQGFSPLNMYWHEKEIQNKVNDFILSNLKSFVGSSFPQN